MANPIKSNEIIIDKVFQPSVESGIAFLQVITQLEAKFKDLVSTSKGNISGIKPDSYQNIKKLGEETEKVTAIYREAQRMAEQRIITQAKIALSVGHVANKLAEETSQLNENNKLNRENAKLHSDQTGAYDKLNITLNKAARAYRDLAAAEMSGTKEAKALLAEIQATDAKLKTIDASMGRFQRNVGNYTGATNGLRLSIGQIARELPSLQNGFTIFASAIGNNVAAVSDSIAGFRKEQALLRAEGLQTQSLLKAVAGSIFSFNTALLVAVTLFTVFSKDISEWGKSLFASKSALDQLKISQQQYAEISQTARKNAVDENVALTILLATAKNIKLSLDDRKIAVDELQKTYPKYFDNLTQEQILAGDTAKAEYLLRDALFARARTQAATNKIEENSNKILDLRLKLDEKQADITRKKAIPHGSIKLDKYGRLIDAGLSTDIEEEKELQKDIKNIEVLNNKLYDMVQEGASKINDLKTDKPGATGKPTVLKSMENNYLKELELQHQVNIAEIEATKEGNREKIALINENLEYEMAVNRIKVSDYDKMLKLNIAAAIKADDEIKEILKSKGNEDAVVGTIDGKKYTKEGVEKENQARNAKSKAEEQKQNEAILAKSFQTLKNTLERENQAKLRAIDQDIAASQRREDAIRNIAEKGANNREENIAFERRQQAQLEKERDKRIKKQIQQQQVLALLQAFASGNSKDAGTIKGLASSLPAFYEGTEDTGTVANPLDNNGGRVTITHDNERIISKRGNDRLKGIDNDTLVSVGESWKLGKLIDPTQFDRMPIVNHVNDERHLNKLNEVSQKLSELNQTLKSQPVERFEYDEVGKMIITTVKEQYKTTITKSKPHGW